MEQKTPMLFPLFDIFICEILFLHKKVYSCIIWDRINLGVSFHQSCIKFGIHYATLFFSLTRFYLLQDLLKNWLLKVAFLLCKNVVLLSWIYILLSCIFFYIKNRIPPFDEIFYYLKHVSRSLENKISIKYH